MILDLNILVYTSLHVTDNMNSIVSSKKQIIINEIDYNKSNCSKNNPVKNLCQLYTFENSEINLLMQKTTKI